MLAQRWRLGCLTVFAAMVVSGGSLHAQRLAPSMLFHWQIDRVIKPVRDGFVVTDGEYLFLSRSGLLVYHRVSSNPGLARDARVTLTAQETVRVTTDLHAVCGLGQTGFWHEMGIGGAEVQFSNLSTCEATRTEAGWRVGPAAKVFSIVQFLRGRAMGSIAPTP